MKIKMIRDKLLEKLHAHEMFQVDDDLKEIMQQFAKDCAGLAFLCFTKPGQVEMWKVELNHLKSRMLGITALKEKRVVDNIIEMVVDLIPEDKVPAAIRKVVFGI